MLASFHCNCSCSPATRISCPKHILSGPADSGSVSMSQSPQVRQKTWLEIKTFHINFSTAHTHESKLNAFIKQFSFSLLYFSHHSPKNYIGAQCKFVVNCCKLLKPTSGAAKEETFTWPGRRHSIASMDVALGVKVELGGILMWVRRPREHQTLPPPISGQSQTVRVFDTLSSNGNARHGNLAPISAAVREMCALISAVNFEPEASST